MNKDSIAYPLGDSFYLNLTNRCTNECTFCIRNKCHLFNGQYPLWLEKEPSSSEVLAAIGNPAQYKQIVFCGYGEPLIRLEVVKAITSHLKSQRPKGPKAQRPKVRLDTNGQANLFWGQNIVPELKGLIDFISISLNAENATKYNKLCRSYFGQKAYPAIIDFIKECKKYIPKVEASVVVLAGIDQAACQKLAQELGVLFRVRPYYKEKYVS